MKVILLALLSVFSLLCTSAKELPNILFLFTDDQSYETIGEYGVLDIDTPHMDSLASKGVTFSHAYNMGSWAGAVCVASRSCLITGKSVWYAKSAVKNAKSGKGKVWGQYMSDAGYDTYMMGKWHIPYSTKDCFDKTANVRAGMPKALNSYNRPVEGEDPEKAWLPWDESKQGFWIGGKHWSEVTADDCIGFLEEAGKETNPFFMYVAFNAPHDPRQSPKEYVDRYPLDRIKLPESYQDLYPEMGEEGVPKIRDENLAPFPRTEYAVKVHRQEYFALITHLDDQIGRILEALEKSGKADNTWIIFTSDHGLAVGHHGLLGKQNMYEHSLRAPFMISGPGIKEPGRVIDAPIYLQDAMPTALELSGQEIPEGVDYKSVLPLIDGRRAQNYDSIYGAYIDSQRAIIKGKWKLIVYPKMKKYKLFNLEADPLEMSNLAQTEEHAEKLNELIALLELKMDELGDPMTSLTEADHNKK